MKLGHTADEIKFDSLGDPDGTGATVARYLLILEGEPVFSILCDSADPNKVIYIGRGVVDHDTLKCNLHETAGRFVMTADLTEGPDGSLLDVAVRVNEKSVYAYVLPRLHILLARLLRTA